MAGNLLSRNYCVVLYYGRFLLFYTLPALLVMAMPLSSRWEGRELACVSRLGMNSLTDGRGRYFK